MSTALIDIGLLVVAAVVIYFATRRKPDTTAALPNDPDTAWNDPLTPGQPARTDLPNKDKPSA